MTDQRIEWADRDDLEAVAIQVIYQMKDCTGLFRDYENHFYIGKVPPEHYGKIQSLFFSDWFNRANEQANKSKELFYSGMNIIPLSRLPDEILNIVLERRRFTECKDSPEYILQRIIKTLEEGDGIKADLTALQPLTVDAAEQSDAANQERTDAAAQPPAASSSIEKEPSKHPRAGGGSSEQSRRKKASEIDVLKAMELLRERAETPNIKDWEKGTIVLFLKEKGYNLELSKKTKIGKYWAILYEKKTGAPPPHWYQSDIQEARRVLTRDGINFDWFL